MKRPKRKYFYEIWTLFMLTLSISISHYPWHDHGKEPEYPWGDTKKPTEIQKKPCRDPVKILSNETFILYPYWDTLYPVGPFCSFVSLTCFYSWDFILKYPWGYKKLRSEKTFFYSVVDTQGQLTHGHILYTKFYVSKLTVPHHRIHMMNAVLS